MASKPSTVKVVIRTRPTAKWASGQIKVHDDKCTLSLNMPKADNPNALDSWTWRFDAILHNSSQETVYSEQVAPIVKSVLQGFNGAFMCYGQARCNPNPNPNPIPNPNQRRYYVLRPGALQP